MNAGRNSWNHAAPRILCISPHFAPTRDSEAFCSTKFINALTECGAQITVIAYAKPAKDIDRSEMWNSLRATVVRIPPLARKNPFVSLSHGRALPDLVVCEMDGRSHKTSEKTSPELTI